MAKRDVKTEYINALKDAGKILIEQAENLMDDIDVNLVSDFTIWLKLDKECVPTMEISKEYALHAVCGNHSG